MARAGAQVTATDLSAPLLSALQQAGAQLEGSVRRRVRTRAGDMRSLRLRQRFPLVVAPSSTFLHLYNRRDVEAFLAGVLHHLTADGVFVFDVALPRAEELVNGYDPVAQIRTIPWVGDVLLAQRQYFPRELQMLLEYNGLTKVRVRGDFGRGTPTADTKVLVFTARAAAGRSRKPRTLRTAKATSQATRSGGRGC
jgi:SAM-dependent methyltransferase